MHIFKPKNSDPLRHKNCGFAQLQGYGNEMTMNVFVI